MQVTTTKRVAKASNIALAPFSAMAAKLIQQAQAEAHEQLLTDLSDKDAIIVLHCFEAGTKVTDFRGDHLQISNDKGNDLFIYPRRTLPESWADNHHSAASFTQRQAGEPHEVTKTRSADVHGTTNSMGSNTD